MIKDLLFPSLCLFCGLHPNTVCENCLRKYFWSLKPRFHNDIEILNKQISLVDYKDLYKNFIHHGKYRFNKEVWRIIGSLLFSKIDFSNSIVTYVPLHWIRFCYRGFNQSKLMVKEIREPVKLLNRVKHESSFTKLDRNERIDKSKELFEVKRLDLGQVKRCYLVDDVITTGATMRACAELIKSEYPEMEVIGLCFAKTPKD